MRFMTPGSAEEVKTKNIITLKGDVIMGYYGPLETWKIVYYPKILNAGMRGVAFVEADCRQMAIHTFMQQYEGQYHTIEKCEKLIK